MTAAIVSHHKCSLHEHGLPHHPEDPFRLSAVENQLIASGIDWIVLHYDSEPASEEQLLRVHTQEHIEFVKSRRPERGKQHSELDGDTWMNPDTYDAALHAAGAAVKAVDLVMSGEQKKVFCNVRPPGHHAGRDYPAGFCIFNNVAVGAAHAIEKYGLQRVAILDFDVHHGDGTEHIFENDDRVLFGSTFQHPFYPNKGADTNRPGVLNIPLPVGTNSSDWNAAVQQGWLPALREFEPELIFISAGFDSHTEDDMGGFKLVEGDYQWITNELCKLAKEFSQDRLISCLEGGYDLSSLGRSAAAHIKQLAEFH